MNFKSYVHNYIGALALIWNTQILNIKLMTQLYKSGLLKSDGRIYICQSKSANIHLYFSTSALRGPRDEIFSSNMWIPTPALKRRLLSLSLNSDNVKIGGEARIYRREL